MRRRAIAFAVAGGLLLTLSVAYLHKVPCAERQAGFMYDETRWCLSDLWGLWDRRWFDVDAVPYVARFAGTEYSALEYPPGLGYPVWYIGLATDSRRGFFDLNAATLAVAAVVAAWQLDRGLRGLDRPPSRLLGFALAPAVAALAFQSWDLWVVATVAVGMTAAIRGRSLVAGAWFGIGAAIKWWPALLVLLLLTGPWARGPTPRTRRDFLVRAGPALVAALAWSIIQLPAIVASPGGWWATTAFHLSRGPNRDSLFGAIGELGTQLRPSTFWTAPQGGFAVATTVVTLACLVIGIVYVLRRVAAGTLEPADAALALVCVYLVTGKVFSPQFVLWLVPLAVLSRVSWTPVLAVEGFNLLSWLLIAQSFATSELGYRWASQAFSVGRSVAVAWLLIEVLRYRRDDTRPEAVITPTLSAQP